ncbi:nitrilase-related carbon-nitrogen hydrolase [Microvirga pakistanensis]|uniref:nitrilase-related carbon-nitrogen hydrolase n=1 Tax=Microvirga pakistanensis TaxID=1682650 RepID=UPI00106B4870|nr:nitrilase-related carbon-nitrogen hydrolase [Microvirga pakistanensis]
MRILKLAAAQIETPLGDLDANLRKHLDVIAEARAAGAQVLVFPELSLVGHSGGREATRLALRMDHPALRELSRASGPMLTIVGGVEEAAGALFFNSAFGLTGERVAFVYRKINLATYGRLEDGKFYGTGTSISLHPIGMEWHASVMICADLWNPGLVHWAALSGTNLLLAPISSAREAVGDEFDNREGWAINARFHAMTYGFPLVLANRVGREGELTFWGGSRILGPAGNTLAQAEDREALIVTDIDYEAVRQARFLLPTVRDGAATLLARAFTRLAEGTPS